MIDAAIVRDPVMKDLIMVVKKFENSLPAEKNLYTRITRKRMDFLLPFLLPLQEIIGVRDLRHFLQMMLFMSILINTVIINMELLGVVIMERHGKMCLTVSFQKEPVTQLLLP